MIRIISKRTVKSTSLSGLVTPESEFGFMVGSRCRDDTLPQVANAVSGHRNRIG